MSEGDGPRPSRPHAGGTPAVHTTADQFVALLDHLGIGCAHVASNIPGDLTEVAAGYPDRLGGIVLCAPVRLDPEPFAGVAGRLLIFPASTGRLST